jgi:2-iminobutanoate/2-iminopropanoate deaminase
MKNVIHSNNAPEPIGPYSQAIEKNGTLYLSGQIGIDASTGTLITDIEDQYRQVLINIGHILETAGYSYDNVVKSTVFINDMRNFSMFNNIYAEYFTKPFPARSVIESSALPKGALVEMEVVAVK